MRDSQPQRSDFLKPRIRPWGMVAAAAAGALVSSATLLGFCASLAWFFELFSHFRVQYFLALTLAALLMLPRQRKLAAFFGVLAAANLCVIAPLYVGAADPPAGESPTFRAMLLNVNTEHGDAMRVAGMIAELLPDLVVLEEVNKQWLSELESAVAAYPHAITRPRSDNFGIAVYSKFPFSKDEVLYLGDAQVPSIRADIETEHGRLTLIATHPLPPTGKSYTLWRNEQLVALAALASEATAPVLLLGDLNVTPWNPHFRRLLKTSGLLNSAKGHGIQATWPTYNPLLRIPLDHCLHSPEIAIIERRVGPNVGSDHYPVIVEAALPAAAEGSFLLRKKVSAVPPGLVRDWRLLPTIEMVDYSRLSLRDRGRG